MNTFNRVLCAFALAVACCCAACADEAPSPYKVAWSSPSTNWNGTMPLGNGELAVNAYLDGAIGRLHLLLARIDAMDELGRHVKIAEVLVDDLPAWTDGVPYLQTLDSERGTLSIAYGSEQNKTSVEIWVEVDRPTVVVEVDSANEIAPRASFYIWRDEDAGIISNPEVGDLFWKSQTPAQIRPDVLADDNMVKNANQIAVYHRNVKTPYFDEVSKTQGTDGFPGNKDPFVNRTFGALISSPGATRVDANSLVAPKARSARFEIVGHVMPNPNGDEPERWFEEADAIALESANSPVDVRRQVRDEYWKEFNERSWVRFAPNEKACANQDELEKVKEETRAVSLGYAMQRFIAACHGRGKLPIKFNGGLFTTAPVKGAPGRHDYRRWGAGYWFQNTRLAYYPFLASGDFDFMAPFFNMYCGLVPLCEYRVQKYYGGKVQGCYFPECIYFWGDVFPEAYGLTPWDQKDDPLQSSGYHRWEWVGGLEIAFLALQYYEYTLDEKFLKEKAIPTALSVLKFFDTFYKVNPETGKLKMSPGQACETWWDCDNATPEVAGLRAVLKKTLSLPDSALDSESRKYCAELLERVPEIPTRILPDSGKIALAPAARFEDRHNIESPELYPVFPFRLYSFEQPNADYARNAMEPRITKSPSGWVQDELFYAYLGDRANLRDYLSRRAAVHDPNMRFPAFWGPNFDWTPDQDHGGILFAATESAIVQYDGDKIFLNPACPKEWNADFKLWAPKRTVLEGKIVDGEVVDLKVTPEERRNDVIIVK